MKTDAVNFVICVLTSLTLTLNLFYHRCPNFSVFLDYRQLFHHFYNLSAGPFRNFVFNVPLSSAEIFSQPKIMHGNWLNWRLSSHEFRLLWVQISFIMILCTIIAKFNTRREKMECRFVVGAECD